MNSSGSKTVRFHVFLFHFLSFSLYAGNLYYGYNYLNSPGRETYGGRWKYLTSLNEVLQCMYFMSATLGDILLWMRKQKKENSSGLSRDIVFASLAFPAAMFVSVMFWTIYAVDRELIFSKSLDAIVPSFVNHVWHTACFLLMIVEALIIDHEYPATRNGLFIVFLFSASYVFWLVWQVSVLSYWAYPFLNVLSTRKKCVFFIASYGVLCLFYFVGQYITSLRKKLFASPVKQKL